MSGNANNHNKSNVGGGGPQGPPNQQGSKGPQGPQGSQQQQQQQPPKGPTGQQGPQSSQGPRQQDSKGPQQQDSKGPQQQGSKGPQQQDSKGPQGPQGSQQPPPKEPTGQQGPSTTTPNEYSGILDAIFNKNNIMLIVWFLVIYFLVYYILGIFFKSNSVPSLLPRIFDLFILGLVLLYLLHTYYTATPDEREKYFSNAGDKAMKFFNDKYSAVYIGLFLVLFYLTIMILRVPMIGESAPITLNLINNGAWILLAITIIVLFFKHVLGISLIDGKFISSYWNDIPSTPSEPVQPVDTPTTGNVATMGNAAPQSIEEVFNVSNNLYTYDDAQAVCAAYGARLATYDEIEDAYNNGADWCNYGWSDGQMAFFPTQKETWTKLQKNPKRKNDCGRPGVNGGYMANPYLKFGVNCYGKRPDPTQADLNTMAANAKIDVVVPKTDEEKQLDKKVQFWKENADKLLNVNSFNREKWSEY
jgi:hypothetical protein